MTATTPVPLVDLQWQHAQVAHEVEAGFAEVLATGNFVGGAQVRAFEFEYADLVGVPYCVGVGNGTDALELALRALGVGAGHEVLVPSMTFVATAEAVLRCGADPVFVDVDTDHLLIDPERIEPALTRRTRAVIPVHLHGQLAPMETVLEILDGRDIQVIEDAAQAQGASRHGRPAGGYGHAAGTSFYPGKNLGAYGDAGAVLTMSDEVARQVRLLANHGEARKYDHIEVGVNSRLDTLQAVVLRAKLARLTEWNALRVEAAERYDALLSDLDQVVRPRAAAGNNHVWHLYAVRVPQRDRVLQQLRENGVGAGVHYPRPVHLQPAFDRMGRGPGSFPVAEAAASSMLSLPLFPGITMAQQERTAEALAKALR